MNRELICRIALSLIPGIGDIRAKALAEHFGNATDIFNTSFSKLSKVPGIGEVAANAVKKFDAFADCEAEASFIEKNKVQALFITDDDYPERLKHCADAPPLLYYKGNADLNQSRIVSVVGTRSNTEYGRLICEKFIEDLRNENILIISGLAFGIDTIAHRAAIKSGLQTVGVMAHGLDKIYPAQNKSLAKQMLTQGGLLTDFKSGTNPDRQNFPERNRIVAGLCDALVVMESKAKGGSLITAEIANGYNKDVFAFPGRVTDSKSEGCLQLIQSNKAGLIGSAADFLDAMNWRDVRKKKVIQPELFQSLNENEKLLAGILAETDTLHIDQLYLRSGLSSSKAAGALLMMEMKGLLCSLPGKMYRMNI